MATLAWATGWRRGAGDWMEAGSRGSAEPHAFDSPAPTKRLVREYGVALVPGVGSGLLLFLNDHQELAEVDAGCGISPLVA